MRPRLAKTELPWQHCWHTRWKLRWGDRGWRLWPREEWSEGESSDRRASGTDQTPVEKTTQNQGFAWIKRSGLLYKCGLSLSLSLRHTHLAPFSQSEAASQQQDNVPGHLFLRHLPGKQSRTGTFGRLCLWLDIKHFKSLHSEPPRPHGFNSLCYSHSHCVSNCLSCYSCVVKLVQRLCWHV